MWRGMLDRKVAAVSCIYVYTSCPTLVRKPKATLELGCAGGARSREAGRCYVSSCACCLLLEIAATFT